MLIHWKEPRVWIVGVQGEFDKQTGNTSADNVLIIPGVHPMEEKDWERIKNIPDVKDAIAEKKLEVVEAEKSASGKEVDTTAGGYPKTLDGFKPADAVEFVGGVMEMDVLKSWQKIEKRPVVVKAIKVQIEALEEKGGNKE